MAGRQRSLERRARAQGKVAPVSTPVSTPAQTVARIDELRRLEEGVAALRRGGREAILAGRQAPARGELRFRAQAARTGRGRLGRQGPGT